MEFYCHYMGTGEPRWSMPMLFLGLAWWLLYLQSDHSNTWAGASSCLHNAKSDAYNTVFLSTIAFSGVETVLAFFAIVFQAFN